MSIRCPVRPQVSLQALALLVSLLGPAALAQPVGPNPQGGQGGQGGQEGRLTPEQRAKVFPEQRRLALQDRQARIAILRRGESCLQNAGNADALRDCMRTEREAMGQQRRQLMDSLKALYERNGLPAPRWMQRQGRGQGPMKDGPGADI
ncbi:MAG: hypothetical protein VKM17_04905 [Cyanobacteriota bacterium]|nr:hypothetical protein [Cyanobacteriota bacterium]